ncbi:MAG TPA: hypothetical protein VIJ64_03990 [Candidatus Lustribacter sp.]
MIAMTTIAPITIQSHGTVLVVVVVVEVSGFVVVFSDDVTEPVFGVVTVPLVVEPLVAGPVVVVVVLEPAVVPAVCAYAIAGATTRNRARSIRLSRKIGRMWFSLGLRQCRPSLPRKTASENQAP